ncbi:hypothetical protein ACSQ76_07025 [Roseovarius sp. B08]|uniref:hypothetical protein n=1 Tax=Roseovarius sp. B08 TaxID=3449223 RepID=UPI003EDC9DCF
MSNLWFIGDSHVSVFSGANRMIPEYPVVTPSAFPDVMTCRVGPQLAGTLPFATSSTQGRQKVLDLANRIPTAARIFFVFGEIDCRAHVIRRTNYDSTQIQSVVADTITNYFAFVNDFLDLNKSKKFRLGFVAPPPTSAQLHQAYGLPYNEFLARAAQHKAGREILKALRNFFPRRSGVRKAIGLALNYSGTDVQRRLASEAFLEKLQNICARRQFDLLDCYTPFLDNEKSPDPIYFADEIHLNTLALKKLQPQFRSLGLSQFEDALTH